MTIQNRPKGKTATRWMRVRRRISEAIHLGAAPGTSHAAAPIPQLFMQRKTLAGLPALSVPAGISIRSMKDGDEPCWESIVAEAFGWPESAGNFAGIMRADPCFAANRIFFVLRDGLPVATASAWHKPAKFGVDTGYLHFVAVKPGHTNRGLGTLASLVALHAMVADGRTSALLLTDDHRLAAIHIYLKLGFAPLAMHGTHPARWQAVLKRLHVPGDSPLSIQEIAAEP
ncbi:MAG: GNAT family N-acetyltransferase [Planctomycetota bacterium]|nr:GNAT family N-acetyltransferase [Planctomycetota bacterium]